METSDDDDDADSDYATIDDTLDNPLSNNWTIVRNTDYSYSAQPHANVDEEHKTIYLYNANGDAVIENYLMCYSHTRYSKK